MVLVGVRQDFGWRNAKVVVVNMAVSINEYHISRVAVHLLARLEVF